LAMTGELFANLSSEDLEKKLKSEFGK
jgi:hypothetical protein